MTVSSIRDAKGSVSIERIVFMLLLRGEYKLGSAIVLMTVYTAAILVIPAILSSIFSASITYLELGRSLAELELISSIYSEVSSAYVFVEVILFIGFAITCVLSGMEIGRKAKNADTAFSHLGVEPGIRKRVMLIVLFSLSLLCTALGFTLAVILSSASLYSVSILFTVPETQISLNENILIYLPSLILVGYLSLILGWSRILRRLT